MNIIGKMYPIDDKEIRIYINHVLERFSDDQPKAFVISRGKHFS